MCIMYCVCCRDMFCAGRVPEEDLKRTMKACGGSIQTTAQQLTEDVLGQCEVFEEEQIGGERSVRITDGSLLNIINCTTRPRE